MNQRFAGVIVSGTNLPARESQIIDALIARCAEPSLADRRARILADIDAELARLSGSLFMRCVCDGVSICPNCAAMIRPRQVRA